MDSLTTRFNTEVFDRYPRPAQGAVSFSSSIFPCEANVGRAAYDGRVGSRSIPGEGADVRARRISGQAVLA